MKKTIIILILLSIFSVIGCSDTQTIEGQEQQIQKLEKERRELLDYLAIDQEILKLYRDALEDIKEENEDIRGILEEFYLGYYTKSEAIDAIYWHTSNIEDILEEFKIK